MSFLLRGGPRFLNTALQCIPKESSRVTFIRQSQQSIQLLARSLGVLSCPPLHTGSNLLSAPSVMCSCGCGIKGMHTKGDKELVDFLTGEIASEKSNHGGSIPATLGDFAVKQEKADLILTKKFHDEEVTISLNVNHTVDSDLNQGEGNEENLKSLPDFEVDIKIGSKTLSFTCQFHPASDTEGAGEEEDIFGISEVTLYEGEWKESLYGVSGDILDGVMYDLLMNMLEERGISNEFAEKLSDLCTDYEHGLYISLLQNMQTFIQRK